MKLQAVELLREQLGVTSPGSGAAGSAVQRAANDPRRVRDFEQFGRDIRANADAKATDAAAGTGALFAAGGLVGALIGAFGLSGAIGAGKAVLEADAVASGLPVSIAAAAGAAGKAVGLVDDAAGLVDDAARLVDDAAAVVDDTAGLVDDAAKGGAKALAAPKTVKHHIFNKFRGTSPRSQKYRDFFNRHGIPVDKWTVEIPESMHKTWIHGAGRNWTTRWKRWIDANPNASTREVYQQAGKMMDDYGLSGLPMVPY